MTQNFDRLEAKYAAFKLTRDTHFGAMIISLFGSRSQKWVDV